MYIYIFFLLKKLSMGSSNGKTKVTKVMRLQSMNRSSYVMTR
jgi:hypothetical protein